jgi:hypothetical protein
LFIAGVGEILRIAVVALAFAGVAEPNAGSSDPNYDVFVVNRNGSGLRQLTSWPGEDGTPVWSPDGKWIAFTTTHDVVAGHYEIW